MKQKRTITTITILYLVAHLNALFCVAPASKAILTGQYKASSDTNFISVEMPYSARPNMRMQKEAYRAYIKMYKAAKQSGIDLKIISSTRLYALQQTIWNRKWSNCNGCDSAKVRQIMQYVSMPGTSRHHWGSDIDFISVNPSWWKQGEGLRIYKWLCTHASEYGFFQPYTSNPNRSGYSEERWHWSYAPISVPYLENYLKLIHSNDLKGFNGSEQIERLHLIESHVCGIDCPRSFSWRYSTRRLIAPTLQEYLTPRKSYIKLNPTQPNTFIKKIESRQ